MSGGSYEYLYAAAGDVTDLGRKLSSLHEMASRLDGINPDSHAACDTREVIAIIAALEHASRGLADVWHAVEWRDSNDLGEEAMRQVLAEYEAKRTADEAS